MKKKSFYSVIISLFLLVGGYFANNMSLFTGENLLLYEIVEGLNYLLGGEQKSTKESDVVFLNTAYDKELIPYKDEDGFKVGNTEITNRETLYKLLLYLNKVNYKYLIIDIRFMKELVCDRKVESESSEDSISIDERLFQLIDSMDKVVVATHHGIELADSRLDDKSAFADYNATVISTNFIRYEYFDSIPYIPLAVYNDLKQRDGDKIVKCHYPFGLKTKWLKPFAIYTQGWHLCYNSLFLNFEVSHKTGKHALGELTNANYIDNAEYLNIGKEFVHNKVDSREEILSDLKSICENKYVIIGNMVEDVHDTYAGPQSGPTIIYKALKALDDNLHTVSIPQMFFLFLLYWIICYVIIARINVANYLPIIRNKKNKLLRFIVEMFSFTFILGLYNLFEYYMGRTAFSFVLPIIVFSLIKLSVEYKTFES